MTTADPVPVKPEYFALAASLQLLVRAWLESRGKPRVVIGIAGESGSGKSVTATCLARELATASISTAVLHQDDYFRLPPRTNHEHRLLDLANVGPHEVDLELMERHIAAFRARRDGVIGPLVDYPSDRFLTKPLDFASCLALVVEGTYALQLRDIDLRIFLEATHVATKARRRIRNRDIDAPIIDRVLEIEHRLIAPQAATAHILIAEDFEVKATR